MQSLQDLIVYQKAVELRRKIRVLANQFPKEEEYSLKSQIKRCSRSITANIAEGYGRYNYQENIQFLRMARGSVFETIDHLSSAFDEQYIKSGTQEELTKDSLELIKILNGYISYLKNRKDPPKEQEYS